MDSSFLLNDGREAEIEVWGYKELKNCVDSGKKGKKNELGIRPVKGFHFLSDTAIQNLLYKGDPIYTGRNVTPMERQDISGLPKQNYARSIVSLYGGEPIGFLVFNWAKDNSLLQEDSSNESKVPFWRYLAELIDVREDFQNNGIATELIKRIERSDFLTNRILQLSAYNETGGSFVSRLNERELKARDYALIPYDYSVHTPPEKPGIYDRFGRIRKRLGR